MYVALTSFTTIAIGSVSCALAGFWSLFAGRNALPGSAVAAEVTLFMSLVCCLLSPAFQFMNQGFFLLYFLVWGSAVVADSAQLSSRCAIYMSIQVLSVRHSLLLLVLALQSLPSASIQMVGALLLEERLGPGAMLISPPTWRLVRSLEFVDRTKSGLHTCSCKRPWRSKSSTKTKHVVPELSTCHQSTCDPSTFR